MTKLEQVKEILHKENSSLVVYYNNGEIKEYYQDRIKDLKDIVKTNKNALENAIVADKVIGKVAACILILSGVKQMHACIISQLAINILKDSDVIYEYDKRVEYIKNQDGTGMCPMENKYKEENDINKIYKEILNI